MALLEIQDLSVRYTPRDAQATDAVRAVSFEIGEGEFVGLVGESGSGKSTLGNAVLRLLSKPARQTAGRIRFDGRDLASLDDEELRSIRWVDLSTVFQSSMNSLNPVIPIRDQFEDTYRAHGRNVSRKQLVELLGRVDLEEHVLDSYPHELSGGMKQRVALALALALEPRFILLDEPTTGLDVLVQRRILDRLRELQSRFGFAVLFISHDIGTVLEIADRVLVMYQGEIVEQAGAVALLETPQHEYTRRLLASYEATTGYTFDGSATAAASAPVLEVVDVRKRYRSGRGKARTEVQALDGVSLQLHRGRVTALVGQSGSGKSTIGRMLLGVERPDSGEVRHGDTRVDRLRGRELRDYRRHVQLVFQDPYSSLNPTSSVFYSLSRPLINYGGATRSEARQRAAELLEQVGLSPAQLYLDKLPAQLSGGQRQRVVIARALAPNPTVLVADEPVSSLDVSIRASILDLLRDLVEQRGLAMLYITHDLLSARALANDTVVLHRGVVVESGETERVIDHAEHSYTQELLAAIPDPRRRLDRDAG